MSVVTLPSDPGLREKDENFQTPSAGMQGLAELSFDGDGVRTRLRDLYQTSPLRVLLTNPVPGDVLPATVVNTAGGLAGGDCLDIAIDVGAGGAVQIVGQAAEKVYRSKGEDTHFKTHLKVGEKAWLEWLPQETIVFDRARLRRQTVIDVARGGMFFGAEFLVFGRTAMGERLHSGLVNDVWKVSRSGTLVWMDALYLDGDIKAQLDHGAGFGGANAMAVSLLVADGAGDFLPFARSILEQAPDGVTCAATLTNGILLTRWLACDTYQLRQAFAVYWSAMRQKLKGLPEAMPRLWHM